MEEMEKKVFLGNIEPKIKNADTRRQYEKWIFTYHFTNGGIFPYTGQDLEIFWENFKKEEELFLLEMKSKCIYFSYGHEICPETKRAHLQGYLRTKKPARISEFKKFHLMKRLFLKVQKGTDTHNLIYTSKDMYKLITYDRNLIDTRLDIQNYINKLTTAEVCNIINEYSKNHKEIFINSAECYSLMKCCFEEHNDIASYERLIRSDLEDILFLLKKRKKHIYDLNEII